VTIAGMLLAEGALVAAYAVLTRWHRREHVDAELTLIFWHGDEPRSLTASQICDETGYRAGTVYPVLARLEARGVIVSEWVDEPAPRRRVYTLRLTP
jgi:DNA-binding MarR family transcriptional regulator